MPFSTETRKKIVSKDIFREISEDLNALAKLSPVIKNGTDKKNGGFPKKCTACHKLFDSEKAFFHNTTRVSGKHADVCYTIGGTNKIYRYRNCLPPCGSTLAHVADERRDTSAEGLARRKIFGRIHESVIKLLLIGHDDAHHVTLYLFRLIIFEGMDPKESYDIMKIEVKDGRFKGFFQQPPIKVENISA